MEFWEVADIEGEVRVTWEIISTFGLRTGSVYPRRENTGSKIAAGFERNLDRHKACS